VVTRRAFDTTERRAPALCTCVATAYAYVLNHKHRKFEYSRTQIQRPRQSHAALGGKELPNISSKGGRFDEDQHPKRLGRPSPANWSGLSHRDDRGGSRRRGGDFCCQPDNRSGAAQRRRRRSKRRAGGGRSAPSTLSVVRRRQCGSRLPRFQQEEDAQF
jgi:hypothetical protein